MTDFFRDKRGRVHPIASSPGYDLAFVGLKDNEKAYLRAEYSEHGTAYTFTTPGRVLRAQAAQPRTHTAPVSLAPYMTDYRFGAQRTQRKALY